MDRKEALERLANLRRELRGNADEDRPCKVGSEKVSAYLSAYADLSRSFPESEKHEDFAINLSFVVTQQPVILPAGTYLGASFRSSEFRGGLEITDSHFRGGVSFYGSKIKGNSGLSVRKCLFESGVDLKNTDLNDWALVNCTCQRSVRLTTGSAVNARLTGSKFNGGFSASNVVFQQFGVTGSTFLGHVYLDGCKFEETVQFSDLAPGTFGEGKVYFDRVVFKNDVDFDRVTFLGTIARFRGAEFHGVANFSRAEFAGEVIFNNAHFHYSTSFFGCRFAVPPTFHNATLHRDTSFTDSRFVREETEADWRAYRRLREIMHDAKASFEEGDFFAQEQRTLANLHIRARALSISGLRWLSTSWDGGLSRLYDLLSSYGQSIRRPLIWLAGSIAYFSTIFYLAAFLGEGHITAVRETDTFPVWLGVTLQNVFNPFGVVGKPTLYIVQGWLLVVCMVQSIVSLLLIALTILAARRRFRKGNE